jgi:tRNA-specific 2-thiouridylase
MNRPLSTFATQPGPIVDASGKVLGQHEGIINYTIGQRRGLGIAGGQPLYVKDIDAASNTVVLAKRAELRQNEALITDVNLIGVPELDGPLEVMARHRYRCTEQPATVYPLPGDSARVVFAEPQHDLSRGQALVMYNDDLVLGGGVISEIS